MSEQLVGDGWRWASVCLLVGGRDEERTGGRDRGWERSVGSTDSDLNLVRKDHYTLMAYPTVFLIFLSS